ncbi:MAG: 2Fe-2S iron-sulfur cluster-binding protein [Bryobacteraceae bacterium]
MISVTIDGMSAQVQEGTMILQAARLLNVKIPTLCYHPMLRPFGACRLCVVELHRKAGYEVATACNTPCQEGMVVVTDTPHLLMARRLVLELMLARWPNVPVLRKLAEDLGLERPRFASALRDEREDACILCLRCVHICDEVVGACAIGFEDRGVNREVVTPFHRESESCIACGACAHVCPTSHIKFEPEDYRGKPAEFLLGPNTAIYMPTAQAVPKVPSIDREACIHFKTGTCRKCAEVCEPGAVNHEMQDQEIELDVGQILVATGFDLFAADPMPQYGYGRLDNVYTGLDIERMLNSTGPTAGRVLLKNGQAPRAVGIIHCIGSRDENHHRYCSRVCCMYALKFAHLIKERTEAEVYNFYIDIRAFGKGYEEFYSRVLHEGVNVIRGKVAEVVQAGWSKQEEGTLLIRCEDTLIGRFREIPVDMVVLCNAIEPRQDADQVARLFGMSRSPDGFFLERHPKLDPVATSTDGLFVAGCAQGPKDIPDSVAQSAAAAARMLATISKGVVEIDPVRAEIDEALCSGCRICNALCPYMAISYLEEKNVSQVNSTVCKGCGTCVAACPAGAITGHGFSDSQIYAEMEGVMAI